MSAPLRSLSRFVFLLLCSAALAAAPGCGGDDPDGSGSKSSAGKDRGAKTEAPPMLAPVPVERAPLTGDAKLDLSAKVEDASGDTVRLSSLVAGPTLVYYTSADTKRRANRAASRMLRYVPRGAGSIGFRTVVVFEKGTRAKDAESWFRSRQVKREACVSAIDDDGAFAKSSGWKPRTVALIEEDGTIGLKFDPSSRFEGRVGTDGFTADVLFRAFQPPDDGPVVDMETKRAAVALARKAVATEWTGDEIPEALIDPAKAAGLGAQVKHGVWVELFRHGVLVHPRARVVEGTHGEAIAAAVHQALATTGDEAAAWRAAADEVMVSVHVEGAPSPIPTRHVNTLWYFIEPGIDGLLFTAGDKTGAMLGSEAKTDGLLTPRVRGRKKKLPKLLAHVVRRAGRTGKDWQDPALGELLRFRTTSFGMATPGGPVVDMRRGNVPLAGPVDEAAVLNTIGEGGRWLLSTVRDTGKFDYEYFPNKDENSPGYNIVRHAGSVYGLFEMYHLALQEDALAEDRAGYISAAARALDYVHEGLDKPKGAEADRVCLIYNGGCESGTAALSLLTFLSRPDVDQVPEEWRAKVFREGDDAKIEGLGLVLLDMIDDKGKVYRRYREIDPVKGVKKEPLYYPGESMLALVKLYEATQDERWLEGVRKIGARQVALYAKKRSAWPDHWVMQALPRLWRIDKKDEYAETSLQMALHSVAEQYPSVWTPFPDYRRRRRKDDTPRTTRAGSRAEALRGVVHMGWERGDDVAFIEDALLELTRHLAEQQFGPGNSWWLPNPAKARGGYPMGVVDNHLRIDNNQHVLVGVVGALETIRRRSGEAVAPAGH